MAESPALNLSLLADTLAVCRLSADAPVPAWAWTGEPASVTRTGDELSVVCRADAVPDGVRHEPGWRCMVVAGPLDFALTGIMAALTAPLAAAGIPLFAVSTYDTDYLMVKAENLDRAIAALQGAGHRVE
ncbi:ACT domain-containing protein [Longimicrobium sp.]|uniref:ACT domain-containing protein n=1 Tax=Longimicrobium sp. TaxID=2029185 RepID=UPI002E30B06F|nr:ACT domain-containing protein [Longimicrobium sp.]HEX6036866.1 ACT domain-containing protein [Longimicrobium sp.]